MKAHLPIFFACALAIFAASGTPTFAQSDISQPGELTEQSFGDPNAPVTVIEYASLTCHHCRDFHTKTWPAIREKYVNTGKVRFILREFPLDNLALGGFMLARCAGDMRWYSIVDLLYREDDRWVHTDNPLEALRGMMKQTGMLNDRFEACLRDDALMNKINAVRDRGKAAGVTATPTFFINGQKHSGFMTVEDFSALIDPLLPR